MTQDAQGALRRIMETYARITRFCLVCNYVTRYVFAKTSVFSLTSNKKLCRIIEPLASRCSKFRFTPLDTESASLRLSQIAQAEGININKPVLDTLISTSSGDLRRAITYLQSASRLSMSSTPPTPILPAEIQEIAGVVPDTVINDFARVLGIEVDDAMDTDDAPKQKKIGFDSIRRKVTMLMREGYSASQIISQVR
jgi:replication factor C subunit 2/4